MKTFVAPAWLKKELSDGTFTYTPVLHPDFAHGTPPCVTGAVVDDDTPFSADVWHLATGADGVETYTLIALDDATRSLGMLTLQEEAECTCTNEHCNGTCMPGTAPYLGGTLCTCSC